MHLAGTKRWQLYPPRCSEAVARAMRSARRNAFGNLEMSDAVADALAQVRLVFVAKARWHADRLSASASMQAGIRPLTLESRGGDVVLVGKHVWHCVHTLEPSTSLASDRMLTDQLDAMADTIRGFEGRPLAPAKWCVRYVLPFPAPCSRVEHAPRAGPCARRPPACRHLCCTEQRMAPRCTSAAC